MRIPKGYMTTGETKLGYSYANRAAFIHDIFYTSKLPKWLIWIIICFATRRLRLWKK